MCVSLYGNGEKTGEPILDTNSVRRTVAECNLFLDDLAEVLLLKLCRSLRNSAAFVLVLGRFPSLLPVARVARVSPYSSYRF